MKARVDLLTIGLAILLSYGFNLLTYEEPEPICEVEEVHNGKKMNVPYFCKDVLPEAKEI